MIVIDVESSGTNYEKHSILSLGALDFDHPDNQFYEECRIWEGARIMDEALEINGITAEEAMSVNKQTEAELIRKFLKWAEPIRDHTFAGQNVSFDRDFIKAACDRADLNYPFAHRTIDTHTLCYMHMVKRGLTPPFDEEKRRTALNLDAVLNYCGIPDEPMPHNALTGAQSHAEVTARLLFDKPLLPAFGEYPIPWRSA
jgi:DNA polymerase III epsilon subunit-like protein